MGISREEVQMLFMIRSFGNIIYGNINGVTLLHTHKLVHHMNYTSKLYMHSDRLLI